MRRRKRRSRSKRRSRRKERRRRRVKQIVPLAGMVPQREEQTNSSERVIDVSKRGRGVLLVRGEIPGP